METCIKHTFVEGYKYHLMLFEEKSHFLVPTNCFIVDGVERSLIYDLQRIDYDIIPKELSLAIKKCISRSFSDLFSYLPPDDLDFYDPFIRELIKKDHLIPIDPGELEYFECMSTDWRYPYDISNAIIEYSNESAFDLSVVLQKLDQLNCPAVEIRFTDAQDLSFFEKLSRSIDGMVFRHVDLFIQYKEEQEDDFMFELKNLHPVYFSITQYQAPVDKIVKNAEGQYIGLKRKTGTYQSITDNHNVYPRNFYINREFFTESLNFNPFFNGKIVILKDGSVRNATNQQHSYGNINTTNLQLLVRDPGFTLLWKVSKDNICTCKDCEYRYMCMDSRIPVKNDHDEWIYDDKCNYDPYNCLWSNVEEE